MSRRSTKAAQEAAGWMAEEVARQGVLEQHVAASHLADHFGEGCVYDNDNGGTSISKEVLAEFRKLTEATVVWDRTAKCWRRRESGDGKGRLADGT